MLKTKHLKKNEQFKCLTGGGCVDRWKKCDGNFDCHDQSDESKIVCGKTTFKIDTISCQFDSILY